MLQHGAPPFGSAPGLTRSRWRSISPLRGSVEMPVQQAIRRASPDHLTQHDVLGVEQALTQVNRGR